MNRIDFLIAAMDVRIRVQARIDVIERLAWRKHRAKFRALRRSARRRERLERQHLVPTHRLKRRIA